MQQNESLKIFMRFVEERYNQVVVLTQHLIDALVGRDEPSKIAAAKALRQAADDLTRSLSQNDRPKWLTKLIGDLETFIDRLGKHGGASIQLINSLISAHPAITGHRWSFNEEANNETSFDEIYEHFRNESRLPELFESLVGIIQKMIDTGEIDSITAVDSLKKLVSLIQKNKSGSYFSLMASWEFLLSFTRNAVWEGLEKIPGLDVLKKAFEKTISEMDIELSQLHEDIHEEMRSRFKTSVQSLKYTGRATLPTKKEEPCNIQELDAN